MTATATHAARAAQSPVWPLAVGALVTASEVPGDVRAERRLHLALGAYRLGYYLLDLIEVAPALPGDASPAATGVGWARVEALVARSAADALVAGVSSVDVPLISLPTVLAGFPLLLVAV